jgi:SpoVK/Ycf46/Vps4 family AAA+-type ATPase
VLIGTSRYEDEKLPDLPAVGRGIEDLKAALTDPVSGLVPESHCDVLEDEGDIRLIGRRLRGAASQAEDLLLVYFAGHGLTAGRRHELSLALRDTEREEPEFSALEYDKLRSAVLNSPATTKVIILDCCFSGRVFGDTMTDPATEVMGQVEVDGSYVLVSAHRDQVSLILPGEDHPAFTGRLLRLLHDGVPGGPEFLTIDDMYRQLRATMKADGLPHPHKRGTDSAGLLALARNPAYVAVAQPVLKPRPQISVEDAMAELDAMIGLTPVKEQMRWIAASIEAARRRAMAGITTERPMRHFVFLGPPGTGKTTVARVLAKIFYAFGLLEMPQVIEAHRADLVGEYLGATATKTNELVDSALGGVLFIDEAYRLVNEDDGQTDRFGVEAVQTLLNRAEDNREDLIIILAGYEKQMGTFLASNPGLASRFATRLMFPSYSPPEMLALAESALDRRGERLDPDARMELWRTLEEVGRRRITDELGNGRFVRSMLERAGQARDVRVMTDTAEPAPEDLVTIRAGDLRRGYAELTSRLRGYEDTPTVEGAIAELEELVGLDPVKHQVRAIAAQLRVARLRDQHGLFSQPPRRHFVFVGPPGTGKTIVARILGRIFAALGLLVRPEVIEAHRADLMGEHLSSTAIKTNKLIDSAMGGVLFIDEAHSLHNTGHAHIDALGAEAVQTLMQRAEKDRDRLVIVLAGYPDDMDRFLRSNPGLASRFSTRVAFPSYQPADLVRITDLLAEQTGDHFDPAAVEVLHAIFSRACEAGWIDEFGNGRFARSLFEHACAYRDVRVVRLGEQATAADLTTLTAADVQTAYQELTDNRVIGTSGESAWAASPGTAAAGNTSAPVTHESAGGAAEDMSRNDG